jgi:hypothetical protein
MNRSLLLGFSLAVPAVAAICIASCRDHTESPQQDGSGGRLLEAGGSPASGGVAGVGGLPSITGGSSSGGAGQAECGRSTGDLLFCETLSLDMPAVVPLHPDTGPWGTELSGRIAPGTYVLSDLAKHGDPPSCVRLVSAVFSFDPGGHVSHGWDEGGQSIRYTGTYKDGPVEGTIAIGIECPENAAQAATGLAFRSSEGGFVITNKDGTVMTFTRQ